MESRPSSVIYERIENMARKSIGLVVIGVVVIGAGLAISRSGIITAQGVTACTKAHYSAKDVTCKQSDSELSAADLDAGARLVYTTGSFSSFKSTHTIIQFAAQNADGSYGRTDTSDANDTGIGFVAESIPISNAFANAGLAPEDGKTYMVTVANGQTTLGSTTFTYHT